MEEGDTVQPALAMPTTRGYQQEMLEESLQRNIIIALDTGSGKTHIAVLRLKHEMEREPTKLSWFFAPTIALCEQQKHVIAVHIPVSVGIVSGANEPNQWKDAALWDRVLRTHRIMISTPQVFLDALRHGYISLGRDISLLVFDEAHHAVDNHPYNRIMMEFYFDLPRRDQHLRYPLEVRPMVLGLTASPIYGGDVHKAFKTIERNLDSIIRSPRRHRSELALYVHRPVFKHIMYFQPESPFSTNLASLFSVISTLDIEQDPYVINLRAQLKRATQGSADYHRIDQKLSKAVLKGNTFSHKGLRDFMRAAQDICSDVGPWAADWFICKVMEKTRQAANPYNNIMSTWQNREKDYLLTILNSIVISPISFEEEDIRDSSEKANAVIDCLLKEKVEAESNNDPYNVIIFVQRRDTVIALAELLKCHPSTKDVFRVGFLIGSSDSSYRHSMMDITRKLVKESQENTLADFKIGEKNVIVSTSVAEEGLDIQACCSVIRWDPPPNMASWAQSRGRARKKRSTFTVMFEEGTRQQEDVAKWENLEREMVALYTDPSRDLTIVQEEEDQDSMSDEDNDMEFQVASTGALVTLHSAISHLAHFCAVIPNTNHVDNQPLYDIDPPDFAEGWHSFDGQSQGLPYAGPYGSSVTLPRTLPLPERKFTVDRIYPTKISAHRHAAFKAYCYLYKASLLNEYLLPITSILEPERDEEVKNMLADVEKRAGFAKVSMHIDPWAAEGHQDYWFCSKLILEGLPPLLFCTRSEMISLDFQGGPTLYRRGSPPMCTSVEPLGKLADDDQKISRARQFTRRIFWGLNHLRMTWDSLDFSYLFLPIDDVDTEWDVRRSWLATFSASNQINHNVPLIGNAATIGKQFSYPTDLKLIQKHLGFSRPLKFVRWRYEPLSSEEEKELREDTYKDRDDEITYPLLVVKNYPPRTNFLFPLPPPSPDDPIPESSKLITLLPQLSGVILLSQTETDYAFLLPSVLRSLSMTLRAHSLRRNLFTSSPIFDIPISLLRIAVTAPSTGEKLNYQRMETLGDTVLKIITGIQLLAEYPFWHEGYLTKKKDHTVSNVRLAKKDIEKGLYRWIIRGRKWKPNYATIEEAPAENASPVREDTTTDDGDVANQKKEKERTKKKSQQLSTKVLADVVESLIGAAYLHGGFSLGYECIKFFDLGLKWEPLPVRIEQVLSRVGAEHCYPPELEYVERMLGYTFKRKLLLIEALTHASYQQDRDSGHTSYERLEFLGDSVLDMIVTDYLYHAPGKNYSPGHMHLRKSALVNGHLLAYICLRMSCSVDAFMPRPNAEGLIEETIDTQDIYLWMCLLHSSTKVLEDQQNTATRFRLRREEIEELLTTGTIFPWASLTRLQAPKFFSDMIESIIGATFLDSEGSIPVVRQILYNLGIMPILERVVSEDVDVLHPVSRLSLWAQKNDKTVEYVYEREGGRVNCVIMVDDKEGFRVGDLWMGKKSEEEVKFAAAEQAIRAFKLRDVNINYSLLKKKLKKAHKPKKG